MPTLLPNEHGINDWNYCRFEDHLLTTLYLRKDVPHSLLGFLLQKCH